MNTELNRLSFLIVSSFLRISLPRRDTSMSFYVCKWLSSCISVPVFMSDRRHTNFWVGTCVFFASVFARLRCADTNSAGCVLSIRWPWWLECMDRNDETFANRDSVGLLKGAQVGIDTTSRSNQEGRWKRDRKAKNEHWDQEWSRVSQSFLSRTNMQFWSQKKLQLDKAVYK